MDWQSFIASAPSGRLIAIRRLPHDCLPVQIEASIAHALTRKLVHDRPVTWHSHYAGVRVGVIVERSGALHSCDQWQWCCGFYPGSDPRDDVADGGTSRLGPRIAEPLTSLKLLVAPPPRQPTRDFVVPREPEYSPVVAYEPAVERAGHRNTKRGRDFV